MGIEGDGPGLVRSEIQDGRRLSYADDSFDAAFAVSVAEHIPGDGDTETMRELARVVRPGGRVVVTTPYDREYREDSTPGSFSGKPEESMIWEWHYDDEALERRLLNVPSARCVSRELWGEGAVAGEQILHRARRFRALLSPVEAALAALALRAVEPSERVRAVFFALEKD